MTLQNLKSWGCYPKYDQISHPVYWRSEISQNLITLAEKYGSTLAFGNGRSYGESCLAISNNVIHTRPLNRFISADWNNGVIKAEAGITLEEIINIIIPKGWFLPVTPGTKYATLAGAIANDVHGKNHHKRGTFGRYIKSFSLIRSESAPSICSLQNNPKLFSATIGGLGLTGIIEWAELQLIPITSSAMDVETIRFESLGEFFSLSSELDVSHEYSVAWVDCLAKGESLGRGVFMAANHSVDGDLLVSAKSKISIPFSPPISVINKLTLRFFNSIYYRFHQAGRSKSIQNYDSFFYPLDRILNWNRIYGKKGFQQYQCIIPSLNSELAIKEILTSIAKVGGGSFLAVMKICGDISSPGLLSFPIPGVSLALDFPEHKNFNQKLFLQLDAIVREAKGRLYPAKDAHMSGQDFRHFYPAWEELENLRDPALNSHFWNKVTKQ